ncbi:MAG TPA: aminoglycoside phosphotransferase family protein [Pseudonocardiaceae bacterium]|jgi:aminoglycoside phosphotransferase (APT) family kinase protein
MHTGRAHPGPSTGARGPGTDERQIRDELLPVLALVCAKVGLDHRGATLMRYVRNAVFRLAAHPVVVRIAIAPAVRERAQRTVAVARWLASHDVPAVRLLDGFGQPVLAGGHLATFWHDVPEVGPPPTGADLARLLRRLHELPAPADPLPPWQPVASLRAALAESTAMPLADLDFMLRRCDAVEAALASLSYQLPPGPIHGDAWLGNLLAGPDGPVLCDFDSACIGPREWDLTPMAVGRLRRSVPPKVYRAFIAGYGVDVMRWPGFDVLREVRELKRVAGALPILDSNPAANAEFTHRLRTLRAGDHEARWRPYR